MFRKETPEGQSWFPEINAVWLINESHFQQLTPELEGIPGLIMANRVPDTVNVTGFISDLQPKWADYNGVPLIRIEGGTLADFSFQSIKKKQKPSDTIPRHEMWRRQYRRRPYLRALTKQELIGYFERLIAAQAPGMLKGASESQRSLMRELMEPWTHLLEEVNFRGLNMRELSPMLKQLGKRIQEKVGATIGEDEAKVVIKRDIQGPVTVEHHTRGATANIDFYALSLAASRTANGAVFLDHVASSAPPEVKTKEEASAYGFKEAEERWPVVQGWSHRVDVKLVNLKFEFGNTPVGAKHSD